MNVKTGIFENLDKLTDICESNFGFLEEELSHEIVVFHCANFFQEDR